MSLPRLSSLAASAAEGVRAAIGQAAARTGVDFSYLMAQAKSESGLNPQAKAATSSASGLYQFLDQSWLAVVKRHGSEHGFGWAADAITARPGGGFSVDPSLRQQVMGLREQAGPAALMAASFASDNAQGLGRALNRDVNSTDLYFAHFLGLQGATRFLRAADAQPGACAASLFPREAGANRGIFYCSDGSPRSLAEVYQLMGNKLAKAGAMDGPVSIASAGPGTLVDTPAEGARPSFELAALTDAPAENQPSGDDIATALAQLNRGRMDMLRPTPAQAKLAYLMLSAAPVV